MKFLGATTSNTVASITFYTAIASGQRSIGVDLPTNSTQVFGGRTMASFPVPALGAIRAAIAEHALTPDEIDQVHEAVSHAGANWSVSIEEEVQDILASRRLATRRPLSADRLKRLRDEYLTGRLSVKPREFPD